MQDQLNSTLAELGDIIDFKYYAWGNAYVTTRKCRFKPYPKNRECWCDQVNGQEEDAFSGDWKCQHGDEECEGNAIVNCASELAGGAEKAFPFLYCFEVDSYGDPEYLSECAKSAGLSAKDLKECATGTQGKALSEEAAKRTCALDPPHEYVPWPLVDGEHVCGSSALASDNGDDDALHCNLISIVCDHYKGTKRPAACSSQVQ